MNDHHSGAIRLVNLTLGYDRRPAVHHVDAVIAPGTALAVCGPNGAGKSTLLKGIAGLLAPIGGRIDYDNPDPRAIAYLPQLIEIDRSFPITVRDFVAMGALRRTGLFGRLSAQDRLRIEQAIERVGVIMQNERVILLDEPFGAIDEKTASDLLLLIAQWCAEGRTVIAVLHDLDLARRAFAQALLLARHAIAWGATSDVLSSENLARARAMSESYNLAARECLRDEEGAHVH
ncbi:MAG: metal ABC transporter ATP-binding protein [Methylocystaceae bacterium]|nr:metal ABC transporter ATP-binding protein [Methylocystaceae bacterium]